jgi:hypothetical protein
MLNEQLTALNIEYAKTVFKSFHIPSCQLHVYFLTFLYQLHFFIEQSHPG